MKAYASIMLVTCVLAAGCGDDDNPAAPSSVPLVFTSQLRAANEVPPVTNAESGGQAAVQITVNVTRDAAGGVTAATANYHVQFSGFPVGTRVVGAHIHPGAPGVNGPVVASTGLTAAQPFTLTEGLSTFEVGNLAIEPATIQAIINNPGGFYFNVHSPLNPGGFARGQLVRIQ